MLSRAVNADPYVILELPWGASEQEVRQAFRKLALRYHPDRNPGDAEAEARFKPISAAYQHLKSVGFRLPPPASREAPRPRHAAPPTWSRPSWAEELDWEPPPRPDFWPDGRRIHYPTQREIDDLRRSVEHADATSSFRTWSDRLVPGAVYVYFGALALAAAWGVRGFLGLN